MPSRKTPPPHCEPPCQNLEGTPSHWSCRIKGGLGIVRESLERESRRIQLKRLPVISAVAIAVLFPLAGGAQTFGPAGAYFIEPYVSAGLSQPTTMAFVDANTVLVFEKGSGIVRRAVNGVVQAAPAIDLPVNAS